MAALGMARYRVAAARISARADFVEMPVSGTSGQVAGGTALRVRVADGDFGATVD